MKEIERKNTASLVIYISSYPARPRRITVNYNIFLNIYDPEECRFMRPKYRC